MLFASYARTLYARRTMNDSPPSVTQSVGVRPLIGVFSTQLVGFWLLESYSMTSPFCRPWSFTWSVSFAALADSMMYVGESAPVVCLSTVASISMFPPTCTIAPLPMYAFTVGDAVAVDVEPPTPARRPNAVPEVFASASGRASAAIRRLLVVTVVDEPARDAATRVGLDVAVALPPATEPMSAMPPSSMRAFTLLPLGV